MSTVNVIKAAAVGIALLTPGMASAGTILGATGVSANIGSYFSDINALINQVGLSAGYTSGVTDFQSYLDGGVTHNSGISDNGWAGALNTTSARLIFDLGSARWIDKLVLWNRATGTQGIKDFTLSACDDSGCESSSSLGSYTATAIVGGGTDVAVKPETFAFTTTSTRYLAMNIQNAYSNVVITSGEVAFEQVSAPVTEAPEPASLALLAVGAIGAGMLRRRTAN